VTPTGWLALAAGAALAAGPSPARVRLAGVSGTGRLDEVEHAREGQPPRWSVAVLVVAAAWSGVVVVTVTRGIPLGVAAAAIVGVAWSIGRGALDARRQVAVDAELGTALGVLISELEAGAGPAQALDAAASAAPHPASSFTEAAREAGAGGDAGLVLRRAPGLSAIGLAWQLGEHTGAALAGVLGRVAADLAAATTQRRAVGVALAGPRSSASLLTGLPVLGIALGTAMGAQPLGFLLRPGPGALVGCVGVLLDAAGVLWMRRILRRAAEP
jgi:tight adherence protein B